MIPIYILVYKGKEEVAEAHENEILGYFFYYPPRVRSPRIEMNV
jgi:hypothetical protein